MPLFQGKNYIYVIITAAGFLLLVIVVMYFVLSQQPDNTNQTNDSMEPSSFENETTAIDDRMDITDIPQPTYGETDVVYTEEYLAEVAAIHASGEAELRQAKKVGELLDEMPYQGDNFRLDYSYDVFSFIVIFPRDAVSEGNTEFEAFLATQGVEKKTALGDLQIRYED